MTPAVGSIVLYHRRADEGRGGAPTVPAIVVSTRPDGSCELFVIFGVDDYLAKWSVPRKSDDRRICCWSPTQADIRLAELEQRLELLEERGSAERLRKRG